MQQLATVPGIDDIGISTNGTLLAREVTPGLPMAQALRAASVRTVNISLDTLDREDYRLTTGRDLLPEALAGIDCRDRRRVRADQIELRPDARA